MAKLHHLFVVAAGTEPAPSAAEREKIFVLAISPLYAGEAMMQVSAFQVFLYNMRYNRTVITIPALEKIIIAFQKLYEILIQELPQ